MTSDRILVSVPKRDFKRAVARNLLKRRIRESFRLNKNSVDCKQGYDIAFLFIAGEILKYEIINERVRECLERVHKDS
jgi:ribonuclease P protein component